MRLAVLPCGVRGTALGFIGIPVVRAPNGDFGRLREIVDKYFTHLTISPGDLSGWKNQCVLRPLTYTDIESGDIVVRRWICDIDRQFIAGLMVIYHPYDRVIRPLPEAGGTEIFHMAFRKGGGRSCFFITMRRVPSPDSVLGNPFIVIRKVPLRVGDWDSRASSPPFNSTIIYQQEMVLPVSQTPRVEMSPELEAQVRTERIFLNGDPSRPIDALDVVVITREKTPHWWEGSATSSDLEGEIAEQMQENSISDEPIFHFGFDR